MNSGAPHVSDDIIDDILTDHKELDEYFEKYKAAPNTEEAQKWFHMFVWELCRHSVAEEIVLYNMLENIDEHGKELVKRSREEHRHLKVHLENLQNEKDNAIFDQKFEALFKELKDHLKVEENDDLPYVKEKVSAEERKKAAKSFAMKKKLAPTRPHPGIPDKPAALELAVGLLVTPIDKLRDYFTSFPEEEK